ncbi:hypothetical protein BC833DRAFT_584865 [Globomyces pollinis-pini]|nr:hypothetical protein BC833DRAFT_584865 [Globomyces pollinis-pini]
MMYKNDDDVFKNASQVGTKIHVYMPTKMLENYIETLYSKHGVIWRVLLHNPLPSFMSYDMWKVLESYVEKGMIQYLGICNVSVRQLQQLYQLVKIKPSFVQAELHPLLEDLDTTLALIHYCKSKNITFEAHSVLTGGKKLDEIATKLSLGHQTKEDAANVLISWVAQFDVDICISSTNSNHLDNLIHYISHPLNMDLLFWDQFEKFKQYPFKNLDWLSEPLTLNQQSDPTLFVLDLTDNDITILTDALKNDHESILNNVEQIPYINGIYLDRLKGRSDGLYLFTRVAVEYFGTDLDKATIKDMTSDRESVKLKWQNPNIQSCCSRLKHLLKTIRIKMYENKTGKIRTCKSTSTRPVVDDGEISDLIVNPVPMPVDIPLLEDLEPFFSWIESLKWTPTKDVQFDRGALLSGGHLDMCKQVVGPVYMGNLCQSVKCAAKTGAIKHFLMGNNVAFDKISNLTGKGAAYATEESREEGIQQMVDLMKDEYGIITWYLAGNCIDGSIMNRMADVLQFNTVCDALWLKRNPLGPDGGEAIGRMLKTNTSIKVLDLHNTGLLDEGMRRMEEASRGGVSSLVILYLTGNGLTKKSSASVAKLLTRHLDTLERIYIDMNPLGDEGMEDILQALSHSKILTLLHAGSNRLTSHGLSLIVDTCLEIPTLQILDIGFYLSTLDLGEKFNHFDNIEPLLKLLGCHENLKVLRAENSGISKLDCDVLLSVAKTRPNFTLYCYQQLYKWGHTRITHDDQELKNLIQHQYVQHIYSIYRNNM